MDDNSNRQKLLSIGPVKAEKRIQLTKVLNEWAMCTDVLFEGEFEKYNAIQVYKPSEDSTDMPVFIVRGDNRLFILDEPTYTADINEKEAVSILLGISIWQTWHSNLEQYLIETVKISKQIEYTRAEAWYNQGMRELTDSYEVQCNKIGQLQQKILEEHQEKKEAFKITQEKAEIRYQEQRKNLEAYIDELTFVKLKGLQKQITERDRLTKETVFEKKKKISETTISVNEQLVEIRSRHERTLLKEIDTILEAHDEIMNNRLGEIENKYQHECADIRKNFNEIKANYKELTPQTVIDAKTEMKDKLSTANRKMKQEVKRERERQKQIITNQKAELRLKNKYNADIEIAQAKNSVRSIKAELLDPKKENDIQSQIDDVKNEIRETRKQISALKREIYPIEKVKVLDFKYEVAAIKEEFRIGKQKLKAELKRKLAEIQYKYKSGFKISIRRAAYATDLQDYI